MFALLLMSPFPLTDAQFTDSGEQSVTNTNNEDYVNYGLKVGDILGIVTAFTAISTVIIGLRTYIQNQTIKKKDY